MKTYDSGITAVFQVTNVSSRSDKHLEVFENRYYGFLDDIYLSVTLNPSNWFCSMSNGRGYE
jgi:hypothetical protein